MEKIYKILGICIMGAALLAFPSCVDNDHVPSPDYPQDGSITINAGPQDEPGLMLEYDLYLFTRPAGQTAQDYKLWRTMSLTNGAGSLTVTKPELQATDYKFLFVCNSPVEVGGSPVDQIKLVKQNGAPSLDTDPQADDIFSDMRIKMNHSELNVHNYYAVVNKQGTELIATPAINATLTRMVGQTLYDIYMVTDNNVNNIVGIGAGYGSVLDRVFNIEETVSSVTNRLKFGTSDELIPDGADASVTYTRTLTVDNTNGKTLLPQETAGIGKFDESIYGSTRIYGACVFQTSAAGYSTILNVHYYDTMNDCQYDAPHTVHPIDECYPQKLVTLNIPKDNGSLQIYANKYTRTKIGIPCDRVIDVPKNGGFTFDYTWTHD